MKASGHNVTLPLLHRNSTLSALSSLDWEVYEGVDVATRKILLNISFGVGEDTV